MAAAVFTTAEDLRRISKATRFYEGLVGNPGPIDPAGGAVITYGNVTVKIILGTVNEEGFYEAKFNYRNHVTQVNYQDEDCRAYELNGGTLREGVLYSGRVTGETGGYAAVEVDLNGADATRVEPGQPRNDGVVPPVPEFDSWDRINPNLTTMSIDIVEPIWFWDLNKSP